MPWAGRSRSRTDRCAASSTSLGRHARPAATLPPLVTARVDARIALAEPVDRGRHAGRAGAGRRQRAGRMTIRGGKAATVPADRQARLSSPALRRPRDHPGRGAGALRHARRCRRRAAACGASRRRSTACAAPATAASAMRGAVRDLAEAAARQRRRCRRAQPGARLFAADPARFGPYSPSSRLFLNPLLRRSGRRVRRRARRGPTPPGARRRTRRR